MQQVVATGIAIMGILIIASLFGFDVTTFFAK